MKKFFKNKIVIITGHTGIKGSWLTLLLVHLGAKVIGISNEIPSRPSFFKILQINKKIKDLRIDIRNLNKVKNAFKLYKPDYVFHLAAQSLVKKSFNKPSLVFVFCMSLNIHGHFQSSNANISLLLSILNMDHKPL